MLPQPLRTGQADRVTRRDSVDHCLAVHRDTDIDRPQCAVGQDDFARCSGSRLQRAQRNDRTADRASEMDCSAPFPCSAGGDGVAPRGTSADEIEVDPHPVVHVRASIRDHGVDICGADGEAHSGACRHTLVGARTQHDAHGRCLRERRPDLLDAGHDLTDRERIDDRQSTRQARHEDDLAERDRIVV